MSGISLLLPTRETACTTLSKPIFTMRLTSLAQGQTPPMLLQRMVCCSPDWHMHACCRHGDTVAGTLRSLGLHSPLCKHWRRRHICTCNSLVARCASKAHNVLSIIQ